MSVDLQHHFVHFLLLVDQALLVSFKVSLHSGGDLGIGLAVHIAQIVDEVEVGVDLTFGVAGQDIKRLGGNFGLIQLADLVQQSGVVGNIDTELGISHALPLDGSQLGGHILSRFENVALGLASGADDIAVAQIGLGAVVPSGAFTAESQQVQNVHRGQSLIGIKQQVIIEGRSGVDGIGGCIVEVVQTLPISLAGAGRSAVSGGNIDLAGIIGDQEAVLLCQRNQLGRGDHIFRIGHIDNTQQHNVGLHGDLIVGQLDGGVLVAGDDLKVPRLVGIADHNGVALAGAILVDDLCQQVNSFLGSGSAAQQDAGHRDLADTGANQLVGSLCFLVVTGGNGGGHKHALFVLADFGICLTDIVAVAVLHGLAIVVGVSGVGVRVGGGGIVKLQITVLHREAIGIFKHRLVGNGLGCGNTEHLAVTVADVLGAAEVGTAVCRYAAAHIQAGAGESGSDTGQAQTNCQSHHAQGFKQILFHNTYLRKDWISVAFRVVVRLLC